MNVENHIEKPRDPYLEKHRDLYLNDPFFRHAADTLVPLVLDALALRAREMGADQRERVEEIQTMMKRHQILAATGFTHDDGESTCR